MMITPKWIVLWGSLLFWRPSRFEEWWPRQNYEEKCSRIKISSRHYQSVNHWKLFSYIFYSTLLLLLSHFDEFNRNGKLDGNYDASCRYDFFIFWSCICPDVVDEFIFKLQKEKTSTVTRFVKLLITWTKWSRKSSVKCLRKARQQAKVMQSQKEPLKNGCWII